MAIAIKYANSFTRNIVFARAISTSPSSENATTEIEKLAKLWSFAPPSLIPPYPPDQRCFAISCDPNENHLLYRKMRCESGVDSPVLARTQGKGLISSAIAYALWKMNPCLYLEVSRGRLPPLEDLVPGCRQVFRRILDAVIEKRVRSLDPMTLGQHTLDFPRQQVARLSLRQLQTLKVSEEDFLGSDGFVHNWNGFNDEAGLISRHIHACRFLPHDATGQPTARPQFIYSVRLAAMLDKRRVLDESRVSPDGFLIMPKGYGFSAPRYVVMRIDMCHEIASTDPLTLMEDGLIYDFHITSF